jgi:hypothetical protein
MGFPLLVEYSLSKVIHHPPIQVLAAEGILVSKHQYRPVELSK